MNTTTPLRRPLAPTLPTVLLATVAWAAPAAAQAERADADCLACHADLHGQTFTLPSGERLPAWVDGAGFHGSVHGDDIGCTDCHPTVGDYPHRPPTAQTARDYQVQAAEACTTCHFKHATALQDSIHYERRLNGLPEAPTCIDCHGSHAVAPAATPRRATVDRCATCHEDQVKDWQASAHGQAVLAGDPDAPVCADCHGAHGVTDPNTPTAHAASFGVCAKCHADQTVMGRHGLDHRVVGSYLKDFHGASNRIYAALGDAPAEPVASCSDCHGAHTVQSFKDLSEAERADRAAAMCQDCHEGASAGFATAWGSHTPPSERHRPLVWLIDLFYKLMIPLMVLGLIAHILMDLWRTPGHKHPEGHS
ncbi:MAG: cytochrome C [Myxococcales bacterium]|nr:cytochrome C [Myxococcales bacterium]